MGSRRACAIQGAVEWIAMIIRQARHLAGVVRRERERDKAAVRRRRARLVAVGFHTGVQESIDRLPIMPVAIPGRR